MTRRRFFATVSAAPLAPAALALLPAPAPIAAAPQLPNADPPFRARSVYIDVAMIAAGTACISDDIGTIAAVVLQPGRHSYHVDVPAHGPMVHVKVESHGEPFKVYAFNVRLEKEDRAPWTPWRDGWALDGETVRRLDSRVDASGKAIGLYA